jgi:hypothetical protein
MLRAARPRNAHRTAAAPTATLASMAVLVFAAQLSFASTITLSSSVHQNGINSVIGNGVTFTAGQGYDFTGQDFASLATIDSITIALSFFDLDTAPGNLDFDKVTLTLDGVNTGMRLNGFPDSASATQTITDVPRNPATQQPSTSVADAILGALHGDGRLTGGIVSTNVGSSNAFQAPATFVSTLTIVGQSGDGDGGGGGGGGTGNWDAALVGPDKTQSPGSFVLFQGSISNGTGADLFIDTAALDLDLQTPAGSYDFALADEFLNTLGIIPTSGYQGPLFFVELFADAATGVTGHGVLELTVLSPGDPVSRSLEFSIAVVPVATVAEPGVIPLIAVALLALVYGLRRTHRVMRSRQPPLHHF